MVLKNINWTKRSTGHGNWCLANKRVWFTYFVHLAIEISVCYRHQPTKSNVLNDTIQRISQTQIPGKSLINQLLYTLFS